MKKRRMFRKILIVILIAWIVIGILPKPKSYKDDNPLVIESKTKPVLIAHGGGNGEFPDNTLEAFYHAYDVDPNSMMETDVSLTKDGVIILSHDTTLDRKTNLFDADIIDTNYSDLIANEVSFDYENHVEPNSNGYNVSRELIPYKTFNGQSVTPLDVTYPDGVQPRHNTKFLATTLEELIKAFPNNLINVEIKQSGETGLLALAKVIELMDTLDEQYHTYNRIVLASFHKEVYQKLIEYQKATHPKIMYSPEYNGVIKFYVLQFLKLDLFYNDKVSVLQLPMEEYGINLHTKSLIKAAHRHNIAVHYWTIDNPDEMRELIENGADGIMTNVPSVLKQVYDEIFG